ncbi:unnamed protein product [Clavelina lepadiformis]|uniref:HAT C-terminal dimerisation domain-containing protein n=1 Tax=Clavelina lepadiformis TaxID=159417 RepID=A0ABP0FB42_CLALP
MQEVFEDQSATAERVLNGLKAPYLRATFEFMNFVLDELTGLNRLFQSNEFQLHNLYPEVVRVIKMFALNFMKRSYIKDSHIHHLNVDDSSRWLSIQEVYPGLMASDTIKELLPHQKESFLERCREWYREAVKQLYRRINLDDPVLQSLSNLKPSAIVNETSLITAAATIASGLPCITTLLNVNAQQIDRQWRSILADENIISGQWQGKSFKNFWLAMSNIDSYRTLATFVLHIAALPQSTAVVERTFSKLNLNKTKLRNNLGVNTLEAIIKVSEKFSDNFDVTPRLARLHANARRSYMNKYSADDRVAAEEVEFMDNDDFPFCF